MHDSPGRLLAALAAPPWDADPQIVLRRLADPSFRRRFVDAVRYHRLLGVVRRALEPVSDAMPAEVWAELAERHDRAIARTLLVAHTLRSVGQALDQAGVPWVTFKGIVLDRAVYARPGLRTFDDVDVLVPAAHFAAALDLLEETGWETVLRNWTMAAEYVVSELHLVAPARAELDLHWHVQFDRTLRSCFRVDVPGMVQRRRTVDVGSLMVPTLDSADTLVHLALHAAKEGGDKLLHLLDLDQAARRQDDWDEVVRRADGMGAHLVVGVMLQRARDTLGTPVPEDALRHCLRPRLWRVCVRRVEAWQPAADQAGSGNLSTLLARSTRASVPTTVAVMARGLARRLRSVSRGRWERVDRRLDPTDPGQQLFPSGGAAERQRLLDAIAADRSRVG